RSRPVGNAPTDPSPTPPPTRARTGRPRRGRPSPHAETSRTRVPHGAAPRADRRTTHRGSTVGSQAAHHAPPPTRGAGVSATDPKRPDDATSTGDAASTAPDGSDEPART